MSDTVINVSLKNSRFADSVRPSEVRVLQGEFLHDRVVIRAFLPDVASERFDTAAPMTVEYGTQGNTQTFYGYINHIKPVLNQPALGMDRREVYIFGVGATYSLRDHVPRIYEGTSVPNAVADVVLRNHLSLLTQAHPHQWESLTSSGMSDWQFLVSLARKIGWFLWADDTDVHLLPYDTLVTSEPYVFRQDDQRLIEFRAEMGDTSPRGGEKANRTMAGIDARGKAFRVQADRQRARRLAVRDPDPQFSLIRTALPARSQAEATALIQGEEERNRWYLQAEARVKGEIRLRPGKIVHVQTTDDQRSNGKWLVQSVEHQIGVNSYACALNLGRDSSFDRSSPPTQTGRRLATPAPPRPNTLLVNGRWQSSIGKITYG